MKIIIKIINTSKKVLHFIKTTLYIPINIPLVIEQNKFLLYEIRKLNKLLRLNAVEDTAINNRDMMDQTCSSFDYQWEHLTYGIAMPQDNDFMRNIEELICTYTGIPQQWFEVKRILDVGCGSGRF